MSVSTRCVFAIALGFGWFSAVGCDRDWAFVDTPAPPEEDAQNAGDAGPDHPATTDSGADLADADATDADGASIGADAGVCDPLSQFDPPVLLAALNTGVDEESAVLSDSELTIYFARGTMKTQMDIYTATRAHRGDDFGAAHGVDGVSTPALDVAPAPSADGLTMYIDSYSPGYRAVLVATR